MAFLNDLDALVWAATIVAFVVWCLVTFVNFQDWRDHQKIDVYDGKGHINHILRNGVHRRRLQLLLA